MKFNLKCIEKYYNRPSFNFLAYQGFIIGISIITYTISIIFIYIIFDFDKILKLNIEGILTKPFIYFILMFPFINIYTFLTHNFYKLIKHSKFLFNPIHIIISALLISIIPGDDCISNIRTSGEGGAIFLYVLLTILFIPLTTILFTFLPYLVIRQKEKKLNLTINDPLFTKNKFLHYTTLFGTAIYLLTGTASIIVTIIILATIALA